MNVERLQDFENESGCPKLGHRMPNIEQGDICQLRENRASANSSIPERINDLSGETKKAVWTM